MRWQKADASPGTLLVVGGCLCLHNRRGSTEEMGGGEGICVETLMANYSTVLASSLSKSVKSETGSFAFVGLRRMYLMQFPKW